MRILSSILQGARQAAICEGVVAHRYKSAAQRARDGAGIRSTFCRGQGPSLARSHEWPRQVHTARRADPFPSHQGARERGVQEQYRVKRRVKLVQNEGRAGLPVAEAGRKRGQVQCGAHPIPEDEGAAPPYREGIASLDWMKLKVFFARAPRSTAKPRRKA
ncbi:hypothetical protein TcYC6_0127110 [Trypanosoma cruzi]|nr:hypothetical protein TcYC6_0127110 [Trypanosoma cruzi]